MSTLSSTLLAEWLTPSTKQYLKQRIRIEGKDQIIETTDSAVAQQYYRMWLQVPMNNPMQRLARHPLITKQDKQKVDDFVFEQQKSQIKYSAVMSATCLSIYWLFLSRTSFFQKIFNNRERRPIFNIGRKIFGTYLVFLGSMLTMNSHFEKKIPNGLNEMGIFKKYKIQYQQKFV